jgi:hypothetical protein
MPVGLFYALNKLLTQPSTEHVNHVKGFVPPRPGLHNFPVGE